ncbi:MAG: hypothetical protein ABUJ92_00555 [Desulfobacterales bacterium]
MKAILLTLSILIMSGCAGKPQQTHFTNLPSHAAVTGLCTAGAIVVLRKLDMPSPWNEIGGAVACTATVTIVKEVIKDPVFDWGDAFGNAAGAAAVGGIFLNWEF